MSRSRVLLVDADRGSRSLYRIVLERAGYEVLQVSNGLEAIHLVHQAPPVAILLEMTLPFVDGPHIAEELKRTESTASVPIIVLTAAGRGGTRLGVPPRWCDGYLRKPCDPARLVREVERQVNRDLRPSVRGKTLDLSPRLSRHRPQWALLS